jgi:hypothetical protein
MKDIFFTENGDLYTDNNDIYVAGESNDEAFKSLVLHRLQTKADDWSLENDDLVGFIGLDISSFIGKRITKNLIQAIKYFITTVLTEDNFININDIMIFDLPVDYNTLILKISIMKDSLVGRVQIQLDVTYDLRSNRMIPKIINVPEGKIWQS